MDLYYVDDGVPVETTEFIVAACVEQNVRLVTVDPRAFDYAPERQLTAGDLMYRPAVSLAAQRVEQFLYSPGVSTFYRDEDGVYFACINPTLRHQRAGVPIPRTIPCLTTDRALLTGFVDQLGGFPVVLKMLGFSGGVGVMRVDSLPALFSLVDYARAEGKSPLLAAYVDGAVHWRCVVVGNRVVASYRNRPEADDFRTYAGQDLADYTSPIQPEMEAMAVKAVEVIGYEHGGVDILEHPSGRLYLLEANFPCYYAQAQSVADIDVAGAMVRHLVGKAARLAS